MKVLIYIGSHDNNDINAAFERVEAGDDVLIIRCDMTVGICRRNPLGNRLLCKYCVCMNNSYWKNKLEQRGARVMSISSITKKEDYEAAQKEELFFNSIQELKNLEYQNVEIGFGAFSSYASNTRNVMPDMTEEFKKYMVFIMRKEIVVIRAIGRVMKEFNPDLMIFHNGRHFDFKPLLGLAQTNNIHYITTEEVYYNGKVLKDNFDNDVVHSISAKYQKILDNWEIGQESLEEKVKIGKSFFEKRRNKIASGDTIYTKDQEKGLLPDGFNNNVEVISIFNSSEDEFCAVSHDYDRAKLFENQYIALKAIFDHYKNDTSKHFYLRIHPHLKDVPYRSHMALYDLNYENVTIISPSSPVDSYVLMDKSDKIIVFDSTMAVESAYWGKPVIELSKYVWTLMGVAYLPNTVDELWELVDKPDLSCLYNENCLKYGYSVLKPNCEEQKYVKSQWIDLRVFGKDIHSIEFFKLFGSYKFNLAYKLLITRKFLEKVLHLTKFSQLPCTNR